MNTSHYPSLELCKKLTEIGFPDTENGLYLLNGKLVGIECSFDKEYVCPSVMEILDTIPKMIQYEDRTFYITKNDINNNFVVGYGTPFEGDIDFFKSYEGNLPNALAEMRLWLHENNYISFTK